jgi:hypothetical protein
MNVRYVTMQHMPVDILINAITAALSAGAASGAKDAAKTAVVDAYDGLKDLIRKRFGSESNVAVAVSDLEAKPDSKGRTQVLRKELDVARAGADTELVSVAQALLALVRSLPDGEKHVQIATGQGIAIADRGSTATVTYYAPPPKP